MCIQYLNLILSNILKNLKFKYEAKSTTSLSTRAWHLRSKYSNPIKIHYKYSPTEIIKVWHNSWSYRTNTNWSARLLTTIHHISSSSSSCSIIFISHQTTWEAKRMYVSYQLPTNQTLWRLLVTTLPIYSTSPNKELRHNADSTKFCLKTYVLQFNKYGLCLCSLMQFFKIYL